MTPTLQLGHGVYIIAEMSANHRGDFQLAVDIIHAAAKAGANAIKLQTYTPDTITLDCDAEPFHIKGTIWEGRTLHDLYAEAMTPWEWQPRLKEIANNLGLDLFSSPFDASAVDFLEKMNVPVYKIASFELVDLPLIRKVAQTGKPLIMSTGMATLEEIEEAVQCFRDAGGRDLILLKCTSAYPAPPEEANLRTIADLAARFQCPAGLSDHTLGSACAVAAVALGARVIEKHFTLSRADGGPDASFSMEPDEFRQMVQDIRTAEAALGEICYDITPKQEASRVFRRSLFVAKDMKKGDVFTVENVRSVRPAKGLHTRYLSYILGKYSKDDISAGTPLQANNVDDFNV